MARPSRTGAASSRPSRSGGRKEVPRHGFVLAIAEGHPAGKEYFFEEGAGIGRTDENEVVVMDANLSRRHCAVARDHGVYILQDLGSRNGTRLNGERLEHPEVLRDGDTIGCGDTVFLFSILDTRGQEVTGPSLLAPDEAARLEDKERRPSPAARARALIAARVPRRAWLAAAAVALAGAAVWAARSRRTPTLFDRSGSAIAVRADEEFVLASFGYGQYDRAHRDKAIFTFDWIEGSRATLRFAAWGVDGAGELVVNLNGGRVATVPPRGKQWSYGHELDLPRDRLKKGENRVEFDNTHNPPAADDWEVSYLEVERARLPPADLGEALRAMELARDDYESREVQPGNLASALRHYRRARDLMELAAERPPDYAEAGELIEEINRLLTRKFEDAMFSARRAERVEYDPQQAILILRRAERFFSEDDFRHRQLRRYVQVLEQESP